MSNKTLNLDIICEITGRRYKEVELPAEIVEPLPDHLRETA